MERTTCFAAVVIRYKLSMNSIVALYICITTYISQYRTENTEKMDKSPFYNVINVVLSCIIHARCLTFNRFISIDMLTVLSTISFPIDELLNGWNSDLCNKLRYGICLCH